MWTCLRVEEDHYSAPEEENIAKCKLTGCGEGWGSKGGAPGLVLPYLDLFGMKGHDKAKEEEGGNADHAFNQEQVERPLLGGTGKGGEYPLVPPTFLPNRHRLGCPCLSLFPCTLLHLPPVHSDISVLEKSPGESALFFPSQTALAQMPSSALLLLLSSSPETHTHQGETLKLTLLFNSPITLPIKNRPSFVGVCVSRNRHLASRNAPCHSFPSQSALP